MVNLLVSFTAKEIAYADNGKKLIDLFDKVGLCQNIKLYDK